MRTPINHLGNRQQPPPRTPRINHHPRCDNNSLPSFNLLTFPANCSPPSQELAPFGEQFASLPFDRLRATAEPIATYERAAPYGPRD